MTFPDTALDVRAELLLSGTWTDITAYLDHGPVSISRGHPDESTTVSPSTLAMTLTNTDGRFTSKNPTGPYYGSLGRNVPCRISVPAQTAYLRLEDDTASYVSTPDSAGLSITGDTEIQVDLGPSCVKSILAAKYDDSSAERSWLLELQSDGTLRLFWSADGTNLLSAGSTAPIPPGRIAVKVTLQVNNGSGGNTVTFWTAPSISGSWTQLGSAVTGSGTTSVFDSTAPVCIAADPHYSGTTPGMNGSVYGFKLISGIGGTTEAYADFTSQTAGTSSFTDGQGNTWTLAGTAEISDRLYRGHFEVPDWPQHQDPSGKTVTVAVAGGGLLRRLGQRSEPVVSPMRRALLGLSGTLAPVAYWPCEDIADAGALGSALGGAAMTVSGTADFAGDSSFACSSPLPVINGSSWYGTVPAYTSNGSIVVRFLLDVTSAPAAFTYYVQLITTGTCSEIVVYAGASGGYGLGGIGSAGTTVFDTGAVSFGLTQAWCSIELQPGPGGTVNYALVLLAPGAGAAQETSGSFTGTIGNVTGIYVNPGNPPGSSISAGAGHITVQSAWQSLFDLADPLDAWQGETAGNRFARLCAAEGIQFRAAGGLDGTVAMGAQGAQTLTALLQECADADRGMWTELRQQLGFGYTTLGALCGQAAAVTVDYSEDHLEMWASDPLEDDQTTVNNVTLTQTSPAQAAAGSASYQAYAAPGQPVDGGRLSTLAPPDGVGTYDQSYSVNLASYAELPDVAGWILHTGTVDEPRYPGIVLDLTNRDLASLFWDILGMDLGNQLVINDPPLWLPPDPVAQLCQQLTENLWPTRLDITVTGVPASPYQVAVCDDLAYGRADTDGSQLASAATSTAMSLSVATTGPSGILWTTTGGDFPFDIDVGGERITVTGITGASSPQSFTVTRSVNGVVKAQAADADVRLWFPPVVALE